MPNLIIPTPDLEKALQVANKALMKPEGSTLSEHDKAAFLTIGAALVLDLRRIADAAERIAEHGLPT